MRYGDPTNNPRSLALEFSRAPISLARFSRGTCSRLGETADAPCGRSGGPELPATPAGGAWTTYETVKHLAAARSGGAGRRCSMESLAVERQAVQRGQAAADKASASTT